MTIKCEISILVSQPTLSIRRTVTDKDLSATLSQGYGEITIFLQQCRVEPAGPPFAIFYTLDRRHMDVEFGFAVSPPLAGKNHIQASETPAGKSVTCLHIGPYDDFDPSYRALTEWIKDNGYEAAGVAYEVYLNDPQYTPADKLETQIYQLIRTVNL
ncbi:MAG: effector-binding domain-containing protein [Paraglaciecola sp.]|jgi:effector-binding domain-containing protein